MNNQKILFPKEHKLFSTDKKVLSIIKKIESYSEIWWEMRDILTSSQSLYEIFKENEIHEEIKKTIKGLKIDEETEEAVEMLAKDYNENRSELQKQRDEFQKFVKKIGKLPALYFLSSGLAQSLEHLLSGTIVTYAKSFNSSTGRSKLKDSTVFNDKSELLNFHKTIIDLRNKHYAHVELRANKYFLKYYVIKDDSEVKLEDNLSHNQVKFCEKFNYVMFIKCINCIMNYLEEEISSMTKVLDESLSSEQKTLLIQISSEEALRHSGVESNLMSSRRT